MSFRLICITRVVFAIFTTVAKNRRLEKLETTPVSLAAACRKVFQLAGKGALG
jgi:hypothetical protein